MDVIIYHSADPDGNFCGAIASMAHPNAELIPYNREPEKHFEIIEKCVGKNVVMMDISFQNWQHMKDLCSVCKKLVWIDHHLSAYNLMIESNIQQEYLNFELRYEHFNWGACFKTWQYFFPKSKTPLCVELVAGYDAFRHYGEEMWTQFYYPFRYAVAHLDTPEKVKKVFNTLSMEDVLRGRIIAEYQQKENEIFVNKKSQTFDTCFSVDLETKYHVLAVNKPIYGHMFLNLLDREKFAFFVGFHYTEYGWKISLRSNGKPINLGEIAGKFGGGGHYNAAGFYLSDIGKLNKILNINF